MTFECIKQVHWLKVLTLGTALVGAPLAACAGEADADVAQNAGELKGGVPNSAKGKGKANSRGHAGAAGAETRGQENDAGADRAKVHGKRGQNPGQGAAAGAPAHAGMPDKAKTKGPKGNAGAEADQDDMNDETEESATP